MAIDFSLSRACYRNAIYVAFVITNSLEVIVGRFSLYACVDSLEMYLTQPMTLIECYLGTILFFPFVHSISLSRLTWLKRRYSICENLNIKKTNHWFLFMAQKPSAEAKSSTYNANIDVVLTNEHLLFFLSFFKFKDKKRAHELWIQ